MEILPPDKYMNFWRVLYNGDEIIAENETEAIRICNGLKLYKKLISKGITNWKPKFMVE